MRKFLFITILAFLSSYSFSQDIDKLIAGEKIILLSDEYELFGENDSVTFFGNDIRIPCKEFWDEECEIDLDKEIKVNIYCDNEKVMENAITKLSVSHGMDMSVWNAKPTYLYPIPEKKCIMVNGAIEHLQKDIAKSESCNFCKISKEEQESPNSKMCDQFVINQSQFTMYLTHNVWHGIAPGIDNWQLILADKSCNIVKNTSVLEIPSP